MLVVNLAGAPSCGKSTGSAYIFSKLKMLGVNAELISEFAKDKVWEESRNALRDQLFIFANQSHKLWCVNGKVDVVVCDSPLFLSLFYGDKQPKSFSKLVMDIYNLYDNMNFYINRAKPYNMAGRVQTEKESDEIAIKIKELLVSSNIPFIDCNGVQEDYDYIIFEILNKLRSFDNG